MSDNRQKPIDDTRLGELLGQPNVPEGLGAQLRRNLHEQIDVEEAEASRHKWQWGLGTSLVANVLFVFMLLTPKIHVADSDLLDMAYAHVLHEQELDGHFVGDTADWMAQQGIADPSQRYVVGLAKNCLIGLDTAQHMRLLSKQQGDINLIVFRQQLSGQMPDADSGQKGDQQWLKMEPREGLQTLVFFNALMSPADVKQLVGNLFAGPALDAHQHPAGKIILSQI